MDGIVHIVGDKKRGYLSDKRFFLYQGFEVVDEAEPYFQLVALTFDSTAVSPSFKKTKLDSTQSIGIQIYYTAQCPFTESVVKDYEEIASK